MRKVLIGAATTQVLIGAVIAQVLVGGSAYAGPAPASDTCSSNDDISLETLEVAVETARRVYRPGQSVTLTVTVNRHVHGTPLSAPAEDITVLSLGTTEGIMMVGSGITDSDGRTEVKLRIPKSEPAGWVEGFTFASRSVAQAPCLHADEYGSIRQKRLFRIKR